MVLPEFGVAFETKLRQSVNPAASCPRIHARNHPRLGHTTEDMAAAVATEPDFPAKLPGRQRPGQSQQDFLPAFRFPYPFIYIASLHSLMH